MWYIVSRIPTLSYFHLSSTSTRNSHSLACVGTRRWARCRGPNSALGLGIPPNALLLLMQPVPRSHFSTLLMAEQKTTTTTIRYTEEEKEEEEEEEEEGKLLS